MQNFESEVWHKRDRGLPGIGGFSCDEKVQLMVAKALVKEREACRGERNVISGGGCAIVVHGGFEVVRAEEAMKRERRNL